jgi:hypothetical protein
MTQDTLDSLLDVFDDDISQGIVAVSQLDNVTRRRLIFEAVTHLDKALDTSSGAYAEVMVLLESHWAVINDMLRIARNKPMSPIPARFINVFEEHDARVVIQMLSIALARITIQKSLQDNK